MARKIGILVSLLIISGVWVWATPTIESESIKKHVHLKISDNDFGIVDYSESYSGSFKVTNTTDQSIELLDVDAGCTCITSKLEKRLLPRFETTKVSYSLAIPKIAGHKVIRKEPVRVALFVRYRPQGGKAISLSSYIKGTIDKQFHCSHKLLYIHRALENGSLNTNGNALTINAFERVTIGVKVDPPVFVPTVTSTDYSHAVTLAPAQFLNGTHKGFVEITATNQQGKKVGRQIIEFMSNAETISVSPSAVFLDPVALDQPVRFTIASASTQFRELTLEAVLVNGKNCTDRCIFRYGSGSIQCTLLLPVILNTSACSSVEFRFRSGSGSHIIPSKAYLVNEALPY